MREKDWINIEDRLPNEGDIVVAWVKRLKQPVCVQFETDKFNIYWIILSSKFVPDFYHEEEISYWMPISTPPCEEVSRVVSCSQVDTQQNSNASSPQDS